MGLRRGLIVVLAFAMIVVGVGAYRESQNRRFLRALEEAKQTLIDGRHASARNQLEALADWRPSHGETLYLLGLSEQLLGRPERAEAAWSRIEAGTSWEGMALVHWSDLEQARGRLAQSEDRLRRALEIPGEHRPIARWDLVRLLQPQGRFQEARQIFQAGFQEHPEPVEALKVLYKLDVEPFPIESARRTFAEAGRLAPDDDRVWLGLAHLATRTGRELEAKAWLERCLERRPDDPAVCRQWLDWALAFDRPAEASLALTRLPNGPDVHLEALRLRAWFAAQGSDRVAEERALRALDQLDPSRPEVIERLAILASETGQAERAASYRQRRQTLEQARSQYAELLQGPDPLSQAIELARLAEELGLAFDARCWLALSGHVEVAEGLDSNVEESPSSLSDLLSDVVAFWIERDEAPASGSRTSDLVLPRFEDLASAVGLDFVHSNGHVPGRLVVPETMCGGLALLDFDGDGWLDVYVVQGGSYPPKANQPNADRLYRNRGDGTFEDVSVASGIAGMSGGYGHGVTVGDFDNDGHPDLFVTRWRSYSLYRNRGDGTFEDVTDAVGLGGERDWPTSAAFADLDNDGWLDLYVCHYLEWDEHGEHDCIDAEDPSKYSCMPLSFPARADRVYRNEGGYFVDRSADALADVPEGRALGVVAADLNGDGRIDLFVANDMTADHLLINQGDFRFEEVGIPSGVSGNAQGGYQAGMGTACGDLDGDGRLDLLVTNFYGESTTFFRNLGQGFFADRTNEIGLAAPSRHLLGFGLSLLDANNDGRLDVLSANGHIHDGRPSYPYKMPAQLLLGGPDGRLVDASAHAGAPFQRLHLGRGLAVGDLDNDGRVDALLLAQNEPIVYLHNQTEPVGHFLTLWLEGTASNRDAIGALVTLEAEGRQYVLARTGGGSYQSSGDPRLQIGLGRANQVDRVEIRWPSGRLDHHTSLSANTGYRLVEGDPQAYPLSGFAGSEPLNAGEAD